MKKIVLITGGTGAIGSAIAKKFLEQDMIVIANYSNDDNAMQNMKDEFNNSSLHFYKCNVSNFSNVKSMFTDIKKEFGNIDILINNAGIEISKLTAMTTSTEWETVLSTNLNGAFHCSQCAVKQMLSKKYGRIINISSIASIHSNIGQGAYSASKAGVNALTRTLAKEVAGYGITVNAIAPGFISTKMTADFNDYVDKIPLQRMGKPDEVADLVLFLASDKANYITGSVYNIDGGLSL